MDRIRHSLGVPLAACLVGGLALGSGLALPRGVEAASTTAAAVGLSTTTVPLGGQVTVSAAGFMPSATVMVSISQMNGDLATLKANGGGVVAPTAITIPATFHQGTATKALSPGMHTLTLMGSTSHRTATVQLTLVPSASVSSSAVPLGGQVTVSGAGFVANATVTVSISQMSGTLATIKADNNGIVAPTKVTIPQTFHQGTAVKALSPGVHTLTLTGSTSKRSANVQLTLVSTAVVSATTVPLGGQVTVSAAGFAANADVAVSISQMSGTLATIKADNNGVVQPTAITIPQTFHQGTAVKALSPGVHTLTLKGNLSQRTVNVQLTLVPAAAVSATTVPQGGQVTVSGAGFAANANVTVSISQMSGTLATIKADNNGIVTPTKVTIPRSLSAGTHTLTLKGSTNQRAASVQLTVAAVTSATIKPLLPTIGRGAADTFAGRNWTPGEAVTISLSPGGQLIVVHAGARGRLPLLPVRIPRSVPAGTYTVTATGAVSHHTATATLTIR